MVRFLYFTAQWCAPCKKFMPLLREELRVRGLSADVIDVDADPGRAQAFDIQSVPTVVAIRNGKVVDRFGALPASNLRARLDAVKEGVAP